MGVGGASTVGVLLMAYGSPDSLEEMPAYLLDVRGGRPTPPALVEEIQRRYAQIGGRSPLLDITTAQAQALELELNRQGAQTGQHFRLYVGMRHWQPRIAAAVAQMAADGVETAVALVMAPHSSRLSSGAYFARLEEAVADHHPALEVIPVQSWHDHPGLIRALAARAAEAVLRFGEQKPYILFTAHSLPARIVSDGDPYPGQLMETARLVARHLDWSMDRWQFCYQSAGQSAEPWLGPAIEAEVVRLAQSGERNLLVVPVGFVCDHVEVLYDIDIVARGLAQESGARLERSRSLNASPDFILALADLVQQALRLLAQRQVSVGAEEAVSDSTGTARQ